MPKSLIKIVPILAVAAVAGIIIVTRFLDWDNASLKQFKRPTTAQGQGEAGLRGLGLSPDAPSADGLLKATAPLARRWRAGAQWWSVNFQAVRPDGTLDPAQGATVSYVAPKSAALAGRAWPEKSLKRFTLTNHTVRFLDGMKGKTYGQKFNPQTVPPTPQCSIEKLLATLKKANAIGSQAIRISFDPMAAEMFGAPANSWHVEGTKGGAKGWYSLTDCHATGT